MNFLRFPVLQPSYYLRNLKKKKKLWFVKCSNTTMGNTGLEGENSGMKASSETFSCSNPLLRLSSLGYILLSSHYPAPRKAFHGNCTRTIVIVSGEGGWRPPLGLTLTEPKGRSEAVSDRPGAPVVVCPARWARPALCPTRQAPQDSSLEPCP